jgi:hypothetical protein
MTDAWDQPDRGPTPEDLMAFADGELPADRQAAVASWLTSHPEAAADVEEWRRLGRLYAGAPLPEPSPEAWSRTLARVQSSLTPRPAGRHRPAWVFFAGLAAAVLVAVFAARSWWGGGPADPDTADFLPPDEPFPVAGAHEYKIVSVNPQDADRLIADPPLLGKVEFATAADVRLESSGPQAADGWRGRMEEGNVPMIVPVRVADERDR